MPRLKTKSVLSVVALLVCASLSAAQERRPAPPALDEVWTFKRPPQKGTVTGMSPTEVTLDVGGEKVSFPVNEIKRLSFGQEPVGLKAARRLAEGRRYEAALQRLEEPRTERVGRDFTTQEVDFIRAFLTAKLALSGKGDRDAAYKTMSAFVSQYKNSFHRFAALEVLAELAIARGQYDAAAKLSDELAGAPWPAYKLRAAVLEGRSLQARKRCAEAVEKFEQVRRGSVGVAGAEEPRRLAAQGKAECRVATNSNQQAPHVPIAELHAYPWYYYGDGGCCCWDIEVWQEEGVAGNLTYIDAQVTTPGVTVKSVSDPVPGPGSQSAVLLSANSMRWYLPQPDGLFLAPQTLTACFSNVPAGGASVTLVGYDNAGGTYPDLQTTTVIVGEMGECGYMSDLWMKDTAAPDLPEDFGAEPNNVSQYLWISRDIWVRTSPDATVSTANPGPEPTSYYANEHQHQNPAYVDASTPSYVYVKVRNRGTDYSFFPQALRVYWADANTGLPWPGTNVWNEIDCVPGGGTIDPCQLPAIGPGQDYVVQLPWVPPNPAAYQGNDHFCLVARIESVPWSPFGMATAEGPTLWLNVANNNNIAWKNVTVVTGVPIGPGNHVTVQNTLDREAPLTLRFSVPARELRNHFLLHGEIVVDLGEAVMQKWRRLGQRPRGFDLVGETAIKITDPFNAELSGLLFGPREKHTLRVRMQLRRGARLPAGTTFNWDMIQLAPTTKNARPTPVGGERYTFVVPRTRQEQPSGN